MGGVVDVYIEDSEASGGVRAGVKSGAWLVGGSGDRAGGYAGGGCTGGLGAAKGRRGVSTGAWPQVGDSGRQQSVYAGLFGT